MGALAALGAVACGDGDADRGEALDAVVPEGFELDSVSVMPGGTDDVVELAVWIADDADERRRGLMGVTDLGEADGMLFAFDHEATYRFYMWRTVMPLSIAFFDANGAFVGSADMEPCRQPTSASCPRYTADVPFLTAIEAPAGSLDELGIGPGTSLLP